MTGRNVWLTLSAPGGARVRLAYYREHLTAALFYAAGSMDLDAMDIDQVGQTALKLALGLGGQTLQEVWETILIEDWAGELTPQDAACWGGCAELVDAAFPPSADTSAGEPVGEGPDAGPRGGAHPSGVTR